VLRDNERQRLLMDLVEAGKIMGNTWEKPAKLGISIDFNDLNRDM
jgi:hypothetical protein